MGRRDHEDPLGHLVRLRQPAGRVIGIADTADLKHVLDDVALIERYLADEGKRWPWQVAGSLPLRLGTIVGSGRMEA